MYFALSDGRHPLPTKHMTLDSFIWFNAVRDQKKFYERIQNNSEMRKFIVIREPLGRLLGAYLDCQLGIKSVCYTPHRPFDNFTAFVETWYANVKKFRESHVSNASHHFHSIFNVHFRAQTEFCGLYQLTESKDPFKILNERFDYILNYTSLPKLTNDTLQMLNEMGLGDYFYKFGKHVKDPKGRNVMYPHPNGNFDSTNILNILGASELLNDYYTQETAEMVYELWGNDFKVFGFDRPRF